MKHKWFTELGEDGKGRGINSSPRSGIKYTADILKHAADEGLDVFMLCGMLDTDFRKSGFVEVTSQPFSHYIREVLRAGRNVSILIWDDVDPSQSCPDLCELAAEAESHPSWGRLKVRASGTREGEGEVSHFLIARSPDDQRWIVRIEKPHKRPTSVQRHTLTFEVPAAILFDTDEAKQTAEPLLNAFRELEQAVDEQSRGELTVA